MKEKDNESVENEVAELRQENQKLSKFLLNIEWVLGYLCSLTLIGCILVAALVELPVWARIVLIAFGIISFILGAHFCMLIEKDAGYYECAHCKHKHVPKLSKLYFAMHYGRTRYMECPKCGKRSWQHKTLDRE